MTQRTFGRWISGLRKAAGMSQRELAEKMGGTFDSVVVNELEHDRVDPRTGPICQALAQALSVDVQDILLSATDFGAQSELRKKEREETRSAMLAFRRERS